MRVVKTLAIAAAIVAVTATPAAASGPGGGGWEPSSTPPFVLAAGAVCAFEVKGDIVRDRERMRTLATHPDGTPKVQDFEGVLVIRYTNTSNHKSVVRDATGSIRLISLEDGTRIQQLHGHNALPVKASNTGFPGGDYITHGDFVVIDHPDHVREVPVQLGTMENLCVTLA
ncbi:hypothetical protein Dvina_48365 [Dactylosporangium vinaceum]|uniref:Secreted protein n=1 Tax=Dactylosporangium vinaceum TaxID=53362 RepID=A0ABV5MPT8_9ACTN|nr:hypothetical protein [Dactylosporangium vinaceum]UAB95724.1 hypothetical protein Dvina_48365 [Dactylosporangium vinaceum]